MREKMRVAVIGAGLMGERHLTTYQQLPTVELVAVADASAQRACVMAEQYHLPHYYSDYRQMLEEVKPDAVSICTPDDHHRAPALAAINRGVHLLVEKPLATRYAEAKEMTEAASRAGVVLMVGYCVRFMSPFDNIKDELGKLGEITAVNIQWFNRAHYENGQLTEPNQRDSIITFLATHPLDLVRHLFGEVERIYCEASHTTSQDPRRPDAASMLLKLSNQASAHIFCSWGTAGTSHRVKFSMEVIGKRGQLYCSSLDSRLQIQSTSHGYEIPISYDWRPMVARELQHFIQAASQHTTPLIDGNEALKTLLLTLAAQQSAQRHLPVEPGQLLLPSLGTEAG